MNETIIWHDCLTDPPDDEITVLLNDPKADEPVWPGYKEAGEWFYLEGHNVTPILWAHLPVGKN